jgi:hypothetical protein
MMLTVAEPRQNARVNTNPHSESEKPVKAQKKVTPIFLEKEVRFKSLQNKHKQFWIGLMRKPKEKVNGMVNQSGVAQSFIRDFYFAARK